jgi:hypothetical protein
VKGARGRSKSRNEEKKKQGFFVKHPALHDRLACVLPLLRRKRRNPLVEFNAAREERA